MDNILSGKVREIYDAGEDRLILLTTDRISAFDVILPDLIEGKGVILNQISEFWFNMTRDIVKNHMISTDLNDYPAEFRGKTEWAGRSMLVKKLKILPFECIVSGYLTGSNYKSYKKTGTVCGQPLAQGLVESEKLPEPIFCPSTKAPAGEHDEYITFEEFKSRAGAELAEKVREISLKVYKTCAEYAKKKGIIIADTKFEFGLDENGEIVLADEVLTPDSSRFWDASTYKPGVSQSSFDKQFLRDWLTDTGGAGVSPPPRIPAEILYKTTKKYERARSIIVENNT
ncbi:phosphoribosylaminoimidazole-succinocarboxamide synthase [Clostridia bacterium]|nr:phosphoribosylaminoimidazole-succinocarboxamide synthase [Clostridia bacterium]